MQLTNISIKLFQKYFAIPKRGLILYSHSANILKTSLEQLEYVKKKRGKSLSTNLKHKVVRGQRIGVNDLYYKSV